MQSNSPSGAKLNALEAYLLVSLFFVIATMFEFAFVLMLKRTQENKMQRKTRMSNGTTNIKTPNSLILITRKECIKNDGGDIKANFSLHEDYSGTIEKIDFGSFIGFMVSYIIFNCVYMVEYMN